ncbi:tRNA (N6-isopentenyl adenosine(37)-C2)-methylthiotransferase MiaB [Treponema sp. Marseille-Q4523]|uniref:tRNA (N6-isopentenyl adenosine(37)-C2)-methylthiotransferase MiaB n=1 Tax=Treponema sp. Marseille-Q4523 TaxID=2810610 RepID=UPI00195F99B9|nr:tRNA (N6-isopentenyl adenosine(37)-C2)-methylthiotransferase MiaB [Treponema sp. Marseille-Q4523]MBM7022032.1 tRNA (N6-isopentenyl adenosine(37)-C2)-methylthiotransferase MiaB [Treponema sp. Marseille-Q4523]
MTYYFETYGCQMNIAESASIERMFIARGWQKAEDAQVADVAVINTCSVRATAENRIFGRLGWYAGLKALRQKTPGAKSKTLEKAEVFVRDGAKPLTLVVTGCMAERLLASLKEEYPCIDYVVGTFAKKYFGDIIEAAEKGVRAAPLDDSPSYTFAPISAEPGAFSTFVPIMHGCNNFCTYCIVPCVRGREVSRPVGEVLSELDALSSYGVKEVTLLGQNVNSYCDGDADFAKLLIIISDHLRKNNSPIEWVRFVSSHPKDLSDTLIDAIKHNDVLCRHIHLPVQHGSTKILQAMNRRYTREHYLSLVDRIRAALPDVSLTTDVMLGFPGETDEDFEETLDLMKTVRYENAFMYYYNPREGTPAAKMPNQIPLEVKKARLQKIIDMQLKITAEEMQKRVGSTVKALVESVSRDDEAELLAKTERDERVAFKAEKSLIGKFVELRLTELSGQTFKGQL